MRRSDLSSAIEQRLKAPQTVFGNGLVSIVEQPTVAGLLWNSNLGANARRHKNDQIDHTVVSSFWGTARHGPAAPKREHARHTDSGLELNQRAQSIAKMCLLARAPIRLQGTVVRADGIITR